MLDRMFELIKIIEQANVDYYMRSNPTLSDQEYDKLLEELISIEEETNVILSNSPTQKVSGEVVDFLEKIKHPQKMLSLDKTKDKLKLKAWLGNHLGILSLKLDGITVVLHYNNGVLIQAVTRGNGNFGEDITHNIYMFDNVPLKIPFEGELIVRGEAFIDKITFEKINEKFPENKKYKNPRNLCSGTVRQLDSNKVKDKFVHFYLFDVVTDFQIDSRRELFGKMGDFGFSIVPTMIIEKSSFDFNFEKMETLLTDEVLIDYFMTKDIPVDGFVLSYDSISYGKSLGETGHHPRHSIAFKFEDDIFETSLIDIEWNTSRTGIITPVAIFEPIEIEGTTVERASVHNLSIFEELELGIGDILQVYKANMIIPQIEENLTRSTTCQCPNVCSSCGEPTFINVSDEGVKILMCHNPNCIARVTLSLNHFCSRDAMNIKGLSSATIEKLIDNNLLEDIADIYELKNNENKMIKIPGLGSKSVANLLDSIEASRNVELANFIFALGVPDLGRTGSNALCEYFDNDFEKIRKLDKKSIMRIHGFGQEMSAKIVNFFSDEINNISINKLLNYISFKQVQKQEIKKSSITGTIFVITGKLNNFTNRRELETLIKEHGGIVKSSLTTSVDYLINNDYSSQTEKNLKAKKFNVKIISEQEFLSLLEI